MTMRFKRGDRIRITHDDSEENSWEGLDGEITAVFPFGEGSEALFDYSVATDFGQGYFDDWELEALQQEESRD